MQRLTDSSAIADDGTAMRDRLAADGYLFFRGILAGPAVETVRADVFAALESAGWLDATATIDRPVPSPAAVREGADGYFAAYGGIQRLQRFHELAHDESLLRLVAALVGSELLVHPRKIARTSLPQDDEYTPPHQDFPLIQGTVDTFTVWVPLGDCPVSLGGLRVLVGSHQDGFVRPDPAKGPGALRVMVDDHDPQWATTDYRGGDVLLFTSLTVHGALPNREDRLRFSADFRYQAADEPVVEGSLVPHFFPQVAQWDDLTEGWTSRTSIAAPEGLTIVPLLSPLDPALTAPPSHLLSLA